MDVQTIALDRAKALELYQAYKTHRHYQSDIDWEIQRTYELIAKGKVVIQAIESIKRAGLDEKGLPKLALAGATAEFCHIQRSRNGRLVMRDTDPRSWTVKRNVFRYGESTFEFPPDSFPLSWDGKRRSGESAHKAAVPIIPIHLRPRRGLQNYHVLYEAEWEPVPPVDPYLLRRIGKADLWLVCAAWELTPVEQAAMATRVRPS